ncbi:uncharacterized protein PHALS_05485 [Plasmopara halstedii]|uniref:Uncharacterized protein n=1 Tax=Plasmopara halstedii TaxID=4781 RepID=A0A0N7L7T9_PLAHL|nr:uncharacterized protein PHALS_05485 [Plasmopara halstedii]CEG48003.1 hypothetical protein PHALS_05485 [Plasmopara halstedii]|eukprot:XP_024584372.1 hypothetical protein PHALS_05485 [Plasmopara halstedii]
MDVLENRVALLQAKVVGSSPCGRNTLIDRLQRLQNQLDQLSAAVSGSVKLRELYQEHVDHLQLTSVITFTHSSSKAGDELKRAVILSSADHLQEISTQLQQLQQLTCVLDQLRSPEAQLKMRLTQIEALSDQQRERALAFHQKVEKMLTMYQQMVLVLSEKCVEYNALLDQLQA